MLRIVQCFKECGISQAQLAKGTGWSRALISRIFTKGELPVEAERFTADVLAFVQNQQQVHLWLAENGLSPQDLLKPIGPVGQVGRVGRGEEPLQGVELEGAIVSMAGRIVVHGTIQDSEIFALCRTAKYFLDKLRSAPIGMDELGEIEMVAGRIMAGGEA